MEFIKKIRLSLIALFVVTLAAAQGKPTSSKEVVTGKINGATITINYGSPSVNGRKIWGSLVPFNQVWRAGANDATTFETDKDLVIEGSNLPAGKYSFFIIPNEKESIIIFNKEAKQWGAYKYKDKEDQLRVTIKQKVTKSAVEKLNYRFDTDTVSLNWDNWTLPFVVK